MFNIRNFEETLQTEYAETNDVYKVIRLAMQYIRNEITCGNLVEESKIKWILDKNGCKDGTELSNYIEYLKEIKADYECLKDKVKALSNIAENLL